MDISDVREHISAHILSPFSKNGIIHPYLLIDELSRVHLDKIVTLTITHLTVVIHNNSKMRP